MCVGWSVERKTLICPQRRFRGAGPEITRGVMSTALMLSVKEQIAGLVRQLLGALPALVLFSAVSTKTNK